MSITSDWFYPELNNIKHKWQKFVTSCYIVGGRMTALLVDNYGVPFGLKLINGKPRVSSMPYLFDVAEGNVPDHAGFFCTGERSAVAAVATGVDIWRGTANVIPIPVDAGEQLEVISTSLADDGAPPGTGIRTVHIDYLDAAGVEQEEEVILNGTAAVALNETNVRFVNGFHAQTVGAGGVAAGDITLYLQGSPLVVYSRITTGSNQDLSSQKMIPAGHTFYMTQWVAAATASKPIALRMRMTQMHNVLMPGVFIVHNVAWLQDGAMVHDFNVPIKIPPLTIIKVTGYATQAGANVSASYSGWIET